MQFKKDRISYDLIFKTIFKVFLEKHHYKIITDYEFLNMPKRLDFMIIKSNRSQPLKFFSFFTKITILSYKSIADRFLPKDYMHLQLYFWAYWLNNKNLNATDITSVAVMHYFPRKLISKLKLKLKTIKPGLYQILNTELQMYFVVVNELTMEDSEEVLLLAAMGPDKKKKELVDFFKNDKKMIDKTKDYLYIIDKELLKKLAGEEKMPKYVEVLIPMEVYEKYKNEGLEEGMRLGEEKGLQKGRREEKIQIALTMLKKGIEIHDIADITGLPVRKIKALQRELE